MFDAFLAFGLFFLMPNGEIIAQNQSDCFMIDSEGNSVDLGNLCPDSPSNVETSPSSPIIDNPDNLGTTPVTPPDSDTSIDPQQTAQILTLLQETETLIAQSTPESIGQARAKYIEALGLFYQFFGDAEPEKVFANLGTFLVDFMFIGMRFAITSDMLSESEQGIEHNQDVVAFCREVEDKGCEAGALNGLAFVYLVKLEQPQQAKGYLEQALTIFREIEDLDGQAYTLGNLSETYNQLGQSEQARGCLEQALALYRQTGDVEGEQEILDKLKNLTQSE